ncbi:MAG: single-stranded-DNA-specific exonuclease RecJ [Anaerolineales bacterium]|nr:single-stranded-DNA-specific exonuclease RecJ [Anaerolineales bacterium]
MEKNWSFPEATQRRLATQASNLPRMLLDILSLRGVQNEEDIVRFLQGSGEPLGDPFRLAGMRRAVDRIQQAIQAGENIVVYGDYDADGVTAAALLVMALRDLGACVAAFIPDRFLHGYGLHNATIDQIHKQGGTLLITVDCGIRGVSQVEHACELGMDVIVTDHHQPGSMLPPAHAIIDPKQESDTYGYRDFAGVGLAYKLIQAMAPSIADNYLDLVAVGTIADLAPMMGENRDLVRRGFRKMELRPRPGLNALLKVSGVSNTKLTSSIIGFRIGPRLNAAGRIASAMIAYELLLTQDEVLAEDMALQLESLNKERQRQTLEIVEKAEIMLEAQDRRPAFLLVADPQFNEGVVGLAASRLVEAYYRPAAVAAVGERTTRASVRSIPEFNVTSALDQCEDLLIQHGGHAAAAGFTVENSRLAELHDRLSAIVEEQLGGREPKPVLLIDTVVTLNDLSDDILAFLDQFEPYGQGNPEPVLAVREVSIKDMRAVGKDGSHLKLIIEQNGVFREGIAFRMGSRIKAFGEKVDIAFHFERNMYRGIASQQLNIVDIKNTET